MANLTEFLKMAVHSKKLAKMLNDLFHEHDIPKMFGNHDIFGFFEELEAIKVEYTKVKAELSE